MKKYLDFIKDKKWFVLIILLVAIAVFFGIKIFNKNNIEDNTKEYSISKVERGKISETVSTSGQVETANYLSVTTSVNGIVKEVFVNEGAQVYKGQPIMEITLSSEGEESYASAYASYLSAKSSLESAKNSLISSESALLNAEESFQHEKENNSYQTHNERVSYTLEENNYLVAKNNYDIQKEAITQKQVALNKAWLSLQAQSPTIVAPGDGVVANIVVVEGMDITNSLSERTSTSVAAIKKEGTPIASLSVNEIDINKVSVGQKVRITLTSNEGKYFTGEVVGIDKIGAISNGVASYTVIVKFDEPQDKALPNMGVDADIIINQKQDVLLIPTGAIKSQNGKSMVTKMVNEEETQVEVELGISDGKKTEILSGLEEGNEIKVPSLPTSGFKEAQQNNFDGPRMPGIGTVHR